MEIEDALRLLLVKCCRGHACPFQRAIPRGWQSTSAGLLQLVQAVAGLLPHQCSLAMLHAVHILQPLGGVGRHLVR